MSVFKCKMCGASLNIKPGESIVKCEYCGSTQTTPVFKDDKHATYYDRANHFRRNGEYDKAMGIYEELLKEYPNDAESYWSIILCKYGILYVEDPYTKLKVPTVNRMQSVSIYADENYKQALKYANAEQKVLYEQEATKIDNIQKEFLKISNSEKPFDVFICYKELASDGQRTKDSVMAQDIYKRLTQDGLKVFFSRITLESKLGIQYEPYIFAALHSAKVMVVVGSKKEYFEAPWVKNEWMRYLALTKNDNSKVIVPAYFDIDPYDMPYEFSCLQGQDLNKVGSIQDLSYAVRKLVGKKLTSTPQSNINTSNGVNLSSILQRGEIFLEQGDFSSAKSYANKVLDSEPKNVDAYMLNLKADFNVSNLIDIAKKYLLFSIIESNNNYKCIMKFGNDKYTNDFDVLKKQMQHNHKIYIENTCKKIDEAINASKYSDAQALINKALKFDPYNEILLEQSLKADYHVKNLDSIPSLVKKGIKELPEENNIYKQILNSKNTKLIEKIKKINISSIKQKKYSKVAKLVSIIAVLCIISIICTLVFIPKTQNGFIYKYHILGYYLVDGINYKGDNIIFKNKFKKMPVKTISELHDYISNEDVKTATIENGIKHINKYAFSDFKNITSIDIPDSVTSIGTKAFMGCTNLTDIKIPYKITRIEDGTFASCFSLSDIKIPERVTFIGVDAFAGCNITEITIPNNVTTIEIGAFSECTNLKIINLPNQLTKINFRTFDSCYNLTEIYIPNSVTTIEIEAFRDCTRLKTIYIPKSVKHIDKDAFVGCKNLQIYCEAPSKPNEWSDDWCPTNSHVTWGVK